VASTWLGATGFYSLLSPVVSAHAGRRSLGDGAGGSRNLDEVGTTSLAWVAAGVWAGLGFRARSPASGGSVRSPVLGERLRRSRADLRREGPAGLHDVCTAARRLRTTPLLGARLARGRIGRRVRRSAPRAEAQRVRPVGVYAAVCAAARWLRATPYLGAASAAPGPVGRGFGPRGRVRSASRFGQRFPEKNATRIADGCMMYKCVMQRAALGKRRPWQPEDTDPR